MYPCCNQCCIINILRVSYCDFCSPFPLIGICFEQKPDRDDWNSGLDAMQVSLSLEKSVNQSLLDLHEVASNHKDSQVGAFTANNYDDSHMNALMTSNYMDSLSALVTSNHRDKCTQIIQS